MMNNKEILHLMKSLIVSLNFNEENESLQFTKEKIVEFIEETEILEKPDDSITFDGQEVNLIGDILTDYFYENDGDVDKKEEVSLVSNILSKIQERELLIIKREREKIESHDSLLKMLKNITKQ
jgi:hypothetical protein